MSEERRCYFDGCVATWRHWHGFLPGGYDNPDDPTGVPIVFESEDPDPDAVRDYNGAALSPTPEAAPDPECWTCRGQGWVSGIDADPLPSGEPGEPYQVQDTCPDCGGAGVLPALPRSLDAAWAACEAALPEGWRGPVLRQSSVVVGQYQAQVFDPDEADLYEYAATPTAALDALTAKLKEGLG